MMSSRAARDGSIHFQDGFFMHLFGTSVLLSLALHMVSYPAGSLRMTYASHSLVGLRWSDILHDGLGCSENVFQ